MKYAKYHTFELRELKYYETTRCIVLNRLHF